MSHSYSLKANTLKNMNKHLNLAILSIPVANFCHQSLQTSTFFRSCWMTPYCSTLKIQQTLIWRWLDFSLISTRRPKSSQIEHHGPETPQLFFFSLNWISIFILPVFFFQLDEVSHWKNKNTDSRKFFQSQTSDKMLVAPEH